MVTRKAIADLGIWQFLRPLALTCQPHSYSLQRVRDQDLSLNMATGMPTIIGRAVVALLSLSIKPEGLNQEVCLENFKNKVVYVMSFTVSQKDMLESALRVTVTKEDDWSITKEPAKERYSSGIKEMQEGKHIGLPR
ncbi:hypothetical protein V1517DRAFT_345057 [Lipomyces orientalis]|uniref:Uncharacterized protein n=1 Tax=Lipomyces orientalis TaxID=1233043 RepID=A0ACC3TRM9_9ASCO